MCDIHGCFLHSLRPLSFLAIHSIVVHFSYSIYPPYPNLLCRFTFHTSQPCPCLLHLFQPVAEIVHRFFHNSRRQHLDKDLFLTGCSHLFHYFLLCCMYGCIICISQIFCSASSIPYYSIPLCQRRSLFFSK